MKVSVSRESAVLGTQWWNRNQWRRMCKTHPCLWTWAVVEMQNDIHFPFWSHERWVTGSKDKCSINQDEVVCCCCQVVGLRVQLTVWERSTFFQRRCPMQGKCWGKSIVNKKALQLFLGPTYIADGCSSVISQFLIWLPLFNLYFAISLAFLWPKGINLGLRKIDLMCLLCVY